MQYAPYKLKATIAADPFAKPLLIAEDWFPAESNAIVLSFAFYYNETIYSMHFALWQI